MSTLKNILNTVILNTVPSRPAKFNIHSLKGDIVSASVLSTIVLNIKNMFLIEEEASRLLPKDWIKFAGKELLSKNINKDKRLYKSLEMYKSHKVPLFELPEKLREIVMLSGEYAVINPYNLFEWHKSLNYLDLINILLSEEKMKTSTGYSYKHLIDRFFIEQWAKGKLLYPLILNNKKRFQRKFDYDVFLEEYNIPLVKVLYDYAKLYDKIPIFRNAFYIILATNWKYVIDVKNEDILKLQEIIESSNLNKAQKVWYKRSLNFIVYALLEHGRTDLKTPYEYVNKLFPKELHYYKKVDELVEKCPNFYPIRRDFIEYMEYLDKKERLAKSTQAGKRTHLIAFMDYIIQNKCKCILNQKTFDDMFNFMKEDNIVAYFEKNKGKRFLSILNDIALFLKYSGYFSPYIRKMIPKNREKTGESPRIPFSVEMIKDLADILMNRPPHEPTKWSKEKADVSWWPHDVYPVLPMMILLHLYIPVRGVQIRHLCRKRSFILNNEGKIEKIVINIDKNRNRKYLQEIPFVFSGLEIFNDFLKWHKEYYPVLPEYEYDKNSPFDKIEPLFIQPLGLKPVDKKVHFTYLKRVLAQYRIELSQKGKNNIYFIELTDEGKDILGKEFFESVDELNNTTNQFIDEHVKIIYDIHTFRVTGVTRYLEAGLPINIVMMLTGHTSPNIMLNVYNKLTNEEKKKLLRSAEHKIMFDNPEKLKDNTEKFIQKEILPHYDKNNPDKLKKILSDNNLFTQKVKKSSTSSRKVDAIDEIVKISPLQWIPIAGGICPNVVCPDGREKKCSLCPYFITGIYFIDGIIFRANSAVLNFYQKVEEYRLSKEKIKIEDLELLMEEMFGWYEILNKIQQEQNDKNENNLPVKNKEIVGKANIPSALAYLENYYNAKLLKTAPNIYGIKVLTIKAIKLAMKEQISNVEEIISDDTKAVDYIMSYYNDAKKSPKLLTDFLKSIGENIKTINNLNKIGYNFS